MSQAVQDGAGGAPLSADRETPSVVMFDARYPPPVAGGKEKQAHLLSCALRDLGVDVRVLTIRYGLNQPDELDGVVVNRCTANASRLVQIPTRLRRWRATSNICHVHTPSWIGVYTGLVAKALGYRVIFKIPNVQLTAGQGRLWRRALRLFDRLVVLDERTRQEYEDAGIDPARIILGSNGVVVKQRRRHELRTGLPLRLLFMGRLVEQKGCRQLLVAARFLKQRAADWRLTMVGAGPLEDELRGTIDKWDLADVVTLVPWQDDVHRVLAQADAVILPSHREGMSNVVLEAMSLGVPVVATDVGANRFMLGEEGRPFIVATNDAKALCEAMLAILNDTPARVAHGAALHARARRFFAIGMIAKEYRRIYEETLYPGPAEH
jgi:glycosyltransferase involved in cell wall biosynthesis